MSSTRLVLTGSHVSNYVNIVRAALLEKGLAHEYVVASPSQQPAFLARSPMGKVPVLETEAGCLAETVAILEYLDDRYPDPALRSVNPFARAHMRQAINVLQVYVEVPARSLYPHVFAGAAREPVTAAMARATLDRASGALARLFSEEGFLGGESLSQLDIFAFWTFELVERVNRFVWNRSMIEELSLARWHSQMAERAVTQALAPDFASALQQYLVHHGACEQAREMFADA